MSPINIYVKNGSPIDYDFHWQDMPEFIQADERPYHSIKVQFKDKEAAEAFSILIGQDITRRKLAIWYPPEKQKSFEARRYVTFDES